MRHVLSVMLGVLVSCGPAYGQFIDEFEGRDFASWSHHTGDGEAVMEFRQGDGFGEIRVDATRDRRNIWWAFIKRDVAPALDLSLLSRPGYELRIETRIRVSHAPRRVNLHLNTQRTTDFHSHLMEYDIPDTLGWHTISMTTRDFDARPGDVVNAQMALIDWGLARYRVDVDYFKVDVVDVQTSGPDKGEPQPYHPPIPALKSFRHTRFVAHDAMVDLVHPDVNFNEWYVADEDGKARVLSVNGTLYPILRWDLKEHAGKIAAGAGLLELVAHSVQRTDAELEEFGKIRVVEIPGGDPAWDEDSVTLTSFTGGRPIDDVLNGQMIIDVEVAERGSTFATIPRPVLQRLLSGQTFGIAIRPLGALNAAFFAREHEEGRWASALHFNISE